MSAAAHPPTEPRGPFQYHVLEEYGNVGPSDVLCIGIHHQIIKMSLFQNKMEENTLGTPIYLSLSQYIYIYIYVYIYIYCKLQ